MFYLRPHLTTGLAALAGVLFLLGAAVEGSRWVERRTLRVAAPQSFKMKNSGIAMQRAAFAREDVLPLYGSSELVKAVPAKAADFFAKAPTGFEVFPVGKAGTASLIALEKLGAVGEAVRGRKVAISLSPSWFWLGLNNPHHYEGNFSAEQANAVIFGNTLDLDLRRSMAKRMLEFPETLDKEPALNFALQRLVGEGWMNRAGFALVRPLGWLEGTILRVQDHLHTADFLVHHAWARWKMQHRRLPLNWARLAMNYGRIAISPDPDEAEVELERRLPGEEGPELFRTQLAEAREWGDLEMLLRGLKQLGAKPLLLSMPLDGAGFDELGITVSERAAYYDRLEALAAQHGVPLVDFRDHDEDRRFLADTHDHLSAEGWLFYDEALDAFFHDRPLVAGVAARSSAER